MTKDRTNQLVNEMNFGEIKALKRKPIAQLVLSLFIMLIGISCLVTDGSEGTMYFYCWASLISLCFALILWYYIYRELIAPIPFVIICLYVFNLGVCVSILSGEYNQILYEHTIQTIVTAQKYLLLSLNMFLMGAISVKPPAKSKNRNKFYSQDYYQLKIKYLKLAAILVLVCTLPSYAIYIWKMMTASLSNGYAFIYSAEYQGSLNSFNSIIAAMFEPDLLALLSAYQNDGRKRKILVLICIFIVLLKFLIGGRSGAVMMVLALSLYYYYNAKKLSKAQIVKGLLIFVFLIAAINVTQILRASSGRSIGDYFQAFKLNDGVIFGTIEEFGGSISPLLYTMEIVPSLYPFRYGTTYLAALLSFIPNIGIWDVHPAEKFASLTNWITIKANHTWSGLGYSSTAEAFINFSWFGIIVFLVWGIIITKLVFSGKKYVNKSPLAMYLIYSAFLCLFTSFVRGDFHDIVRAFWWRILPVVILYCVLFSCGKWRNNVYNDRNKI